mgnify:FL=1
MECVVHTQSQEPNSLTNGIIVQLLRGSLFKWSMTFVLSITLGISGWEIGIWSRVAVI